MDAIYYISGTLMTISFIGLVVAIILFLIKPHFLNKNKHITKPVSRSKILLVGLAAIFVTLFGFGGVMAATEPASVREARLAREAAEQKAKQAEEQKAKAVADARRKQAEEAKKPVVKTETKTEIVPFESTNQDDGSLARGETRVATEGVNGERTIFYEVTYVAGKETARKEVKSEVTKQPVTKVVKIGTYVAPVTTPAPTQSQTSVYYKNCSEARAAGAAPVYAGQPGYGRHLDRDGDGVGCE